MSDKSAEAPILSRTFDLATLGDEPMRVSLEATPAECAALAHENGVPAVSSLRADYTLTRDGATRVRAQGVLRARLTQICVVSLDSFESDVVEDMELRFAPEAEVREAEARLREIDEDSDEPVEDPPDPIIDGRIDLGAVTEEFFILGLDPYPRKPGVEFEPPAMPESPDESPFAALGKLKAKDVPGSE